MQSQAIAVQAEVEAEGEAQEVLVVQRLDK